MQTKRCPRCKRDIPLETYGRNRSRYDGMASECNRCRGERKTEQYRRDPAFREKHKAWVKKTHHDWHRKDPATLKAYSAWEQARARKIIPEGVKFRSTIKPYTIMLTMGPGYRVYLKDPDGPYAPENLEVRPSVHSRLGRGKLKAQRSAKRALKSVLKLRAKA